MNNYKNVFILGLIVMFLNCLLFGILKMDLDNKLYIDLLESTFLKIFARLDFFFGFIIPLTILLFFLLTTKMMFTLFDVNSSFKSFFWLLPIGFFPGLVATFLAYFVLMDIDNYYYFKLVKGVIDVSEVKSKYLISFSQLKFITIICYGYLYIHMIFLFVKIYNIDFYKSILIAFVPSVFVFIFKTLSS